MLDQRPELTKDRDKYKYFPGTSAVPGEAAVNVLNRPHSITAHIEIPKEGAEGVLLSHGGNSGGYSLFIKDKKLHYAYNYVDAQRFLISSTENVPTGAVEVRFKFEPTGKPDVANGKGGPGRVQLYINGELVGQGNLPVTIP